jgi:hypothetical protein
MTLLTANDPDSFCLCLLMLIGCISAAEGHPTSGVDGGTQSVTAIVFLWPTSITQKRLKLTSVVTTSGGANKIAGQAEIIKLKYS